MKPFATPEQYEARYGPPPAPAALGEVLVDATREIAAELDRGGIPYADPTAEYAERLMQACRSMAHRAIGAAASTVPAGATQMNQGAGSYTQSFTLGNPYGEVYLSKAERKLLGLGRPKAASVWPYGGGGDV